MNPVPEPEKPRKAGSAEGLIKLSTDFDAPLDDFAEYEKPHILGLHEGQGWISDDFTDELPDSFWFGDENSES